MALHTVLSSKGQVVIPKLARDAAHLKAGQKLAVLVEGDTVLLVPVPKLEDLIGFAPEVDTGNYRDEEDGL